MTNQDSPDALLRLWPDYQPTPIIALPDLAAQLGVGSIHIKNEGMRPLGSFKSLGGMYAGLRALALHANFDSIEQLANTGPHSNLPPLVCASDGNHGLAVAAGAKLVGGPAKVYLPSAVPQSRANRILSEGAEVVWVNGTYETAVRAAADAAERGEGLLIDDTTDLLDAPVVLDVMAGYSVIAREVRDELNAGSLLPPTHIFLQAGVGGFAAAIAQGLIGNLVTPAKIIIVEPDNAACVYAGLKAGKVVLCEGSLDTVAEMLACGQASAPALKVLADLQVDAITVSEAQLIDAPFQLIKAGGPKSTPSGATGLAGLLAVLNDKQQAEQLALDQTSRVLLFATEGPIPLS
jgi:diaminopropionate ammonia-lyase